MLLDDGTFIPHGLNEDPIGYSDTINDPYLRVGRVIKVYEPNVKENLNRNFFEYDIEVFFREASGSGTSIIYPRARISSLFGGVADFISFTPRLVPVDYSRPQINDGSLVLLLCINGDRRQALIIGGIKHPNLPKDDPAKEHNAVAIFNGVEAIINNDGELLMTKNGATQSDGTPRSDVSNADLSTISMLKDGTITFTGGIGKFASSISIDNTNKKISINGSSLVDITTTSNQDGIEVNFQGTKIGKGTNNMLLASTYRTAESTNNLALSTSLTTLSTTLETVGGLLATVAALHVIPVVGPVLGSVPLASAAAGVVAAGGTAAAMAASINEFEAQAATFLSLRNKND